VSDYVDLKRCFIPVTSDAEPELAIARVWGRKYGGWLDWPELLDHARVVLLAEAQSGKSAEFRNMAATLRDGGRPAAYTSIEQLADGRLGLSPSETLFFDTWKGGSHRAWFFLDSVDEARLNRKKFDDALRYLATAVGPALGRANVLVSCRASDWKGTSDLQTILDILPIPRPPPAPVMGPAEDRDAALLDPIFERSGSDRPKPKEEKKKPDVLVVRLVPLTDEQRRIFARAKGINDTDAFVKAIERQGLDVLAERPGDMLELVQHWIGHSRFGTLSAMTEGAVAAKLNEPDKYRPDNTHLPRRKPAKGRSALQRP
jgi:hypothetical protein